MKSTATTAGDVRETLLAFVNAALSNGEDIVIIADSGMQGFTSRGEIELMLRAALQDLENDDLEDDDDSPELSLN